MLEHWRQHATGALAMRGRRDGGKESGWAGSREAVPWPSSSIDAPPRATTGSWEMLHDTSWALAAVGSRCVRAMCIERHDEVAGTQ